VRIESADLPIEKVSPQGNLKAETESVRFGEKRLLADARCGESWQCLLGGQPLNLRGFLKS
jgi:hypothetical protein